MTQRKRGALGEHTPLANGFLGGETDNTIRQSPPKTQAFHADLTKYNAAKQALAAAVRVDEVKDIRDKAMAMRVYAMQAKDRVLIDQATEIRLRAERRAGELLAQMEKNKGAVPGKTGRKGLPVLDDAPKLSDLDINKSQSSRWQKLADISEDDFEELVINAKEKACGAVDRAQQPKPEPKPKPAKKDTAGIIATCVREVEAIVRAAISGMETEERVGLFDQVTRAIGAIMSEAALREARAEDEDIDRWTEH
jgi:hypothetical protein